jgi:transitional endoplasmic reticulum ATPase
MSRNATLEASSTVERVSTQFFNELDNLSDHSQVIVLGASNREEFLDPALTRAGRLDCILRFPIPDGEDRLDIFKVHTSDRPLHDDVDMTDLVLLTDGMVGSQISYICRSAAMMAISELINNAGNPRAKLVINARHFHDAIKSLEK